MLRIPHAIALLGCLAFPALATHAQPAQDATAWLQANVVQLSTPEAGSGFTDMQALKPLIGNARIVSLGEATHGTREFFQFKHRMLEFLATEMGFTIFSIEANMPEAYRLNDYVLHGKGDPQDLLRGMYFWTWNTQEVLDMIKWMRAFNASGRGRVQFTGFDMQTHTVALDIVQQFVARHDTDYASTVRTVGTRIPSSTVNGGSGPGFGIATGTFPVSAAAGHTIRFSGYIRTDGVTVGYAGLWWRIDGAPGSKSVLDNMSTRGARGTEDWRPFSIELPVDRGARNINFGLLMPGNGTAWYDDLSIEIDGQPAADAGAFDLGFESASPRGFITGGAGYRVSVDNSVKRSGRQSLRMTRVADPDAATPADRMAPLRAWSEVLTHLEERRGIYRAAGATDHDIEWAVQNARVVQQAVQMRLGLVSRDRSMALNVKWILDQNPSEKIVLWAHNGHVQRGSSPYRAMGAELDAMYGAQMFVLGFAFNRGAFQAMNARGGGLYNFTVPAAPDGSLDALLGSTGIPMFVVNLRNAPPALREPLFTRRIGALFSSDTEASYLFRQVAPDLYDALLFVDNTSAARPNARR